MKEEESGNHGKRKWKVEYVRERERERGAKETKKKRKKRS